MKSINLSQLQAVINRSKSWVEVARLMGRSPNSGDLFKRAAERHNLSHDHLVSHMTAKFLDPEDNPYPFQTPDRLTHRRAAIGVAVSWFMDHGYTPSLPVEVEKYDLVVESMLGFRKVQVKSAEGERKMAKLVTTTYNADTGKYEQRAYLDDEIDDFFIVCADGERYIIPQKVVSGQQSVLLSSTKYRAFLV